MSESERETILGESSPESWVYEGVVFYAFGEGSHSANTTPVYRFKDRETGHSRTTNPTDKQDTQNGAVAWYVHSGGAPPAGAAIEGAVFRWRPGAEQQGEHQMNIIVSDGKASRCQLMTIRVTGVGSTQRDRPDERRPTANVALCGWTSFQALSKILLASLTPGHPARAVSRVVGNIAEDFMVIPVLPWLLGLYWCLRHRDGRLERALIAAILIVNLGLMLGRQIWLASDSSRRYAVALISLTIFYLPTGLDILTQFLSRLHPLRGDPAPGGTEPRSPWFYLLVVGGVILCAPKLISTPLRAEKVGLRLAGEWLRQNTESDSVVAEPDQRIHFYAQRQGLPYKRYPNSRKADYVVEITRGDPRLMLEGWTRVHSVPRGPKDDRTIIIYRTTRAKD